ncbi:MAG: DUF3299 domain-containing protein [Rhodocyclaceae bacterium]|nr:DUF3299 domain-containing protein [Rhodocyclaceae bacterium]
MRRLGWFAAWALLATVAPAQAEFRIGESLPAPQSRLTSDGALEIDWSALTPAGWQPAKALAGVDLSALSDNDPRAKALLQSLRDEFERAPVAKEWEGKRVRIAGFVVTLERNDKGVTEFLLVPYYGACIHMPPPPANQIIHVLPKEPLAFETAIFPVYVKGVLRIAQTHTSEGMAGYRIASAEVEPYPWRRRR